MNGRFGLRMSGFFCSAPACCPALCLALCLVLAAGPARVCLGAGQDLKLLGGEPVVYACDKNVRITARYYHLADESLYFVKVTTPDGKVYTLPQLVSGSGVRYTNEFQLLWWTKGDTAFAQQPDADGQWRTVYDNCKELPGK